MPSLVLAGSVERAVRIAETDNGFPQQLADLPGYTSLKQRRLLHALCDGKSAPAVRYLEIGAFYGASLLSAAYRHLGQFCAVDNDAEGNYSTLVANVAAYSAKHPEYNNVEIGKADVSDAEGMQWLYTAWGAAPFDVLFFDANTHTQAQAQAMSVLAPMMKHSFVWICDNWNWSRTRWQYRGILKAFHWTEVMAYQLFSRVDQDINGWGNGWSVAVVEKTSYRETPFYAVTGDGPALWNVKARRECKLFTIEDYRQRGL